MKSIGEFVNEVKNEICNRLGENYYVSVDESVIKNNNHRRKAIVIRPVDASIGLVIHLEPFYERFCDKNDFENEVDEIYSYVMSKLAEQVEFDIDFAKEYVPEKLFVKLVNLEKNKERLENIVYKPILDLGLEVRVLAMKSQDGLASSSVNLELLNQWDVDKEQVIADAIKNTELLFPAAMGSLLDAILKDLPEDFDREELLSLEEMQDSPQMYVLTNESKVNGATTLFTSDKIKKFANNYNTDVYILPSSIHEAIILRADQFDDVDFMRSMVKEANTNVVSAEEWLSDNVYYYDRGLDEFQIMEVA